MCHRHHPGHRWRHLTIFVILGALLVLSPLPALSQKEHLIYFPNTDYELNIYKIFGKKPGKTLMLIGGIQGNEPGGFLSADLYADMSLEKGNLIVVPRANFYSIMLNQRGPNGDMNRKFTPEDASASMEDKIVTILKQLISESDFLLNLHDGTGYYYPRHVNKWRNPTRFGQAIIADCSEYRVPGTDRIIKLQEMAEKVIREVNPHIEDDLYKFHFMDTRTEDKDSPHQEQRQSATYYALKRHHIPAFGVETSKFLPTIDLKVRYHNLVINAFKKLFGIIPESPGLILDAPVLKYLVVSINGQIPIVVKNNQTLELNPGDSINVTHIEANYERGLSLDILGYGELNDYRKDFEIFRDTRLIVRKDNHQFAEIPLHMNGKSAAIKPTAVPGTKTIDGFVVEAQGHRFLLADGETLHMVKGDGLKIIDFIPSNPSSGEVTVNFKGFVGNNKNNTGEDRGYLIDTDSDLMERYSLNKKGQLYEIIATERDRPIGRMILSLEPPKLDYLVLRVNGQRHLLLRPEDKLSLSLRDQICLEEIQTNLHSKAGIHLQINGQEINPGEVKMLEAICPPGRGKQHQIDVKKGSLLLGRLFLRTQ